MTTDGPTHNPSRATLILSAILLLIVGAAAGFLIAHYAVDSKDAAKVSTPDPETVTCGAFANLPSDQKRSILDHLNKENDTHVSMSLLDTGCPGLIANSDDPVSGAVINLGD